MEVAVGSFLGESLTPGSSVKVTCYEFKKWTQGPWFLFQPCLKKHNESTLNGEEELSKVVAILIPRLCSCELWRQESRFPIWTVDFSLFFPPVSSIPIKRKSQSKFLGVKIIYDVYHHQAYSYFRYNVAEINHIFISKFNVAENVPVRLTKCSISTKWRFLLLESTLFDFTGVDISLIRVWNNDISPCHSGLWLWVTGSLVKVGLFAGLRRVPALETSFPQ